MVNTAPSKVRVLIVDDSAFMRKVLETIIAADDQLQVRAHASLPEAQSWLYKL